MFTVPTRFPGPDAAAARVMANAWGGHYAALLTGDPSVSAFAEWLAGYWQAVLDRPSGEPDARSPVAYGSADIEWFERDGWVTGHIPGSRAGYRVPSAAALEQPWVMLVESAA